MLIRSTQPFDNIDARDAYPDNGLVFDKLHRSGTVQQLSPMNASGVLLRQECTRLMCPPAQGSSIALRVSSVQMLSATRIDTPMFSAKWIETPTAVFNVLSYNTLFADYFHVWMAILAAILMLCPGPLEPELRSRTGPTRDPI